MARRSATEQDPESSARALRLSALLKATRAEAGLTQQDLAGSAGISLSTLANIEGGRSHEPGFFVVGRIVGVLDEHLDEREHRRFRDDLSALWSR